MDRREFVRAAVIMLAALGVKAGALAASATPAANPLTAPIKRKPINSTSIAEIGYHAPLQVLEIAFRSGAVYRYRAVPMEIYKGLMKAESKGRYFTQNIRNRFKFHRTELSRP